MQSLDSETFTLDGRLINMREAFLELLYTRSLKGDLAASSELHRIRARCGASVPPAAVGYLVVPGPISDEEFEKLAFEQQAQFRERNYGSDAS